MSIAQRTENYKVSRAGIEGMVGFMISLLILLSDLNHNFASFRLF